MGVFQGPTYPTSMIYQNCGDTFESYDKGTGRGRGFECNRSHYRRDHRPQLDILSLSSPIEGAKVCCIPSISSILDSGVDRMIDVTALMVLFNGLWPMLSILVLL